MNFETSELEDGEESVLLHEFELIRPLKKEDILFFNNAYDSCLVPAYLYESEKDKILFFEAIDGIDAYCEGEVECLREGTGWSFVW